MCLTVKKQHKTPEQALNAKPIRASKNIVVYKRLWLNTGLSQILESPYRRMKYLPNKLYQIGSFGIDSDTTISLNNRFRYKTAIYQGLHAYRTHKTAMYTAEYMNIIVKAIIPKGALYHVGSEGDIASTKLFLTNVALTPTKKSLYDGQGLVPVSMQETVFTLMNIGYRTMSAQAAMKVKHKVPKSPDFVS